MVRRVPPPDFRYVWLMPGPGSFGVVLAAAGAAVATTGALLWTGGGHHPLSAGILASGVALTAGSLLGGEHRLRAPARAREVAMAIVPWGILVDPDTEPRVLRWPAIRKVTVDVAHSMRGGTPAILASVVTVDIGRELLSGRAWGAVGLESLVANLEAYAEEAARPVALDLEGLEPTGDGATEPVIDELLTRAEDLCTTGRGAIRLGLPPRGYRSIAAAAAGPETLGLLRRILSGGGEGAPADARPLAAMVAVRLEATSLVPDSAAARQLTAPHRRRGREGRRHPPRRGEEPRGRAHGDRGLPLRRRSRSPGAVGRRGRRRRERMSGPREAPRGR
ncbi:MAG: hypothetical protein QM820_61845 [Minicystis sp.]